MNRSDPMFHGANLVNNKELYHLGNDRLESRNLRDSMPETFERMQGEFERLDLELNAGKASKRKR